MKHTPISTILLLPHAPVRERLLAPHAPSCRRIAPGRMLSWGTLVGEPGDVRHCVANAGSCPVDEHVYLSLARDGGEVYEGVDRLRRVIGPEKPYEKVLSKKFAIPTGLPFQLHAVFRLASYAQWRDLGTLVLLDEHGVEVSGG